jgi:uncharacterized RDD family membrane protein YckC
MLTTPGTYHCPMTVAAGRLEVETSDHVVLRYDLAGAGNRGFAAVVDFAAASLIAIGVVVTYLTLAGALGSATLFMLVGFVILFALTVIWAYFIVLEWIWNGQTIGKRLFGLRVIGDDGAPAGFLAIFIRNLIRVVDFLPALYGFGLLAIVLSPRSQRLGDIAAGTYVVRAPRPQLDYFSLRTVIPIATGASIEARRMPGEAQRLVREFVAREQALRPADRARVARELASRLRAYAPEADPGLDDVEFLRALARAFRTATPER